MAHLLDLPQDDGPAARRGAGARSSGCSRQVPLDRWSAIEDLKLPGIGSEPARQRVYPHGALAGQVLGFTGVDGHGLEGIERALDAELRGEVEAVVVGHDARGRQFVLGEEWGSLPRAGAQIELTIDAALQRVAETELERARARAAAPRPAPLVALDPQTGEVLAMATVPRFDPNQFASVDRRSVAQPRHHRLLRARLDVQGVPRRRRARSRRGAAGRSASSARTANGRSASASSATRIRTAC